MFQKRNSPPTDLATKWAERKTVTDESQGVQPATYHASDGSATAARSQPAA